MNRPPLAYRLRAHIKRGGLIAYPTEFCYGLGCHPRNARAIRTLLQLKKRPQHKGLIVIGANLKQLSPYLFRLPETFSTQLNQTWPAPKTFVLPSSPLLLPILRGTKRNTLAVRVPQHHLARQLCLLTKTPLVSTSCNRAKSRPCKNAREAKRLFGQSVWVIKGQTGGAKRPSEIIDMKSGLTLR